MVKIMVSTLQHPLVSGKQLIAINNLLFKDIKKKLSFDIMPCLGEDFMV